MHTGRIIDQAITNFHKDEGPAVVRLRAWFWGQDRGSRRKTWYDAERHLHGGI